MFVKYWDGENYLFKNRDNNLEFYLLNNKKHRADGPAMISYYDDETIARKSYYQDDETHRKNGPAIIEYHKNGKIFVEKYYLNGKLHRIDGPSVVWYNLNGSLQLKEYWFNNNKISLDDFYNYFPIDTDEKKLYMKLKYGDNNGN